MSKEHGIIKSLRKGPTKINVESKEGQPLPLRSSDGNSGCPSLGIANSFESQEAAIKYLADILVEGFLEIEANENIDNTTK